MATPVGTNVVTSVSRRHLHPQVADNVYLSNPVFFRMNTLNKKMLQGGYQIEAPIHYQALAAGGPYSGYDLLDISPSDTVKNAAWDWRQYYVPVSIDNLSLTRSDHPDAVVNVLTLQFELAEAQMAENLGVGLWSDATTNAKAIDGLKGAVDDGTVAGTYGGLSRTTNTWWKSQFDSSTSTLTLAAMQTMFGNCTSGGRHPTIIITTQANYNRYVALTVAGQSFPVQPQGADTQLAQAGFTNLLFNGVPILVDSHVPANHLFFLNERYFFLYVKTGQDFRMTDFIEPPNQDVYIARIHWHGQLITNNDARHGKMTAVTA